MRPDLSVSAPDGDIASSPANKVPENVVCVADARVDDAIDLTTDVVAVVSHEEVPAHVPTPHPQSCYCSAVH